MKRLQTLVHFLQPIVMTLTPYVLGASWAVAAVAALAGEWFLLAVNAVVTLVHLRSVWRSHQFHTANINKLKHLWLCVFGYVDVARTARGTESVYEQGQLDTLDTVLPELMTVLDPHAVVSPQLIQAMKGFGEFNYKVDE